MFIRKAAVALAVSGAAVLGLALPASALDCHNTSRNVSPAEQALATTATPIVSFDLQFTDPNTGQEVFWNVMPDIKGNWYLLAITEGGPAPDGTNVATWWGFIPPGTVPAFPGANGNYTNGKVDDLLGMSACPEARQLFHGIQSGACGGISLPS
jgi:hypothetical protein